jgi:hypothetical protein
VDSIAMPLIGFQCFHLHRLHRLGVKELPMLSQTLIQSSHRTRSTLTRRAVPFSEQPLARCSPTATIFASHLRVPQGNLLAFTELCSANPTTQILNLVRTLYFGHSQIALTCCPYSSHRSLTHAKLSQIV